MSWNAMRPKVRDDRVKVRTALRRERRAKNRAIDEERKRVVRETGKRRGKNNKGAGKTQWAREMRKMPCTYCGGPGGTVDHVVPIKDGGTTSIWNCVPCCNWCNQHKKGKSYEEFVKHFAWQSPGYVKVSG